MGKRKFLWLLPIVLVVTLLFSCKKEKIINIYGNSALWFAIDSSSMEEIENFDIKFTTKSIVNGEIKEHLISYTKEKGFIVEEDLTLPATMRDGWVKIHEGLDETVGSIIIVYKGKEYSTRGYKFQEERCIKVNLKTTSVEGEFNIVNYNITIIEQNIDVV